MELLGTFEPQRIHVIDPQGQKSMHLTSAVSERAASEPSAALSTTLQIKHDRWLEKNSDTLGRFGPRHELHVAIGQSGEIERVTIWTAEVGHSIFSRGYISAMVFDTKPASELHHLDSDRESYWDSSGYRPLEK